MEGEQGDDTFKNAVIDFGKGTRKLVRLSLLWFWRLKFKAGWNLVLLLRGGARQAFENLSHYKEFA